MANRCAFFSEVLRMFWNWTVQQWYNSERMKTH